MLVQTDCWFPQKQQANLGVVPAHHPFDRKAVLGPPLSCLVAMGEVEVSWKSLNLVLSPSLIFLRLGFLVFVSPPPLPFFL